MRPLLLFFVSLSHNLFLPSVAVFAPPPSSSVPIHLPHPVFPPLCLPPELRHQRTEDEGVGGNESKEREGIDGEGRCAIRCPHGLNMVICHEAESLRKDWLTFTADPRETWGKKTQPSKTPPEVRVQDEHAHMHTSMHDWPLQPPESRIRGGETR